VGGADAKPALSLLSDHRKARVAVLEIRASGAALWNAEVAGIQDGRLDGERTVRAFRNALAHVVHDLPGVVNEGVERVRIAIPGSPARQVLPLRADPQLGAARK
jgi:hypothetical protein